MLVVHVLAMQSKGIAKPSLNYPQFT